jgi:hypothetical protein
MQVVTCEAFAELARDEYRDVPREVAKDQIFFRLNLFADKCRQLMQFSFDITRSLLGN